MQVIFQRKCLLNSTRILVLGVSGGPDSLGLLDLLYQAGYPIIVAHMDHGLRPESAEDARYVQDLAQQRQIPFITIREDVYAFAREQSLSIEEAARILRYRFLFAEARSRNAQAVVVGHTADDQIETVLMHWLRGAGLDGLKGMPYIQLPNSWSDEIPLVRPLLECQHTEILEYCQSRGLKPLMDASNLDPAFFRNRIRHELIPCLQTYNPNIKHHLLQMANIIKEDTAVIDQLVELAWQACVEKQGEEFIGFNRLKFLEQSLGVQRRLVRKAITLQRPGLRDITFQVIDRATDFIGQLSSTGQVDLAAGLRLANEEGIVWLFSWESALPIGDWPQAPQDEVRLLLGTGKYLLQPGWNFIIEEIQDVAWAHQQAQVNQDAYQAWIDAETIQFPLLVRSRKPGDRFQPLGMVHNTIKVSDYMVNAKLPRRARQRWPLVCSQDRIIWLPGFTVSHACRLRTETSKVYRLRLERSGPE